MAVKINEVEVRRIARLARLQLDDAEARAYSDDLSRILSFFEQLQAVNTEGVDPNSHPLPIETVLRKDIPQPSLEVEEALQNAPLRRGDFFSVPAVFGGESGA